MERLSDLFYRRPWATGVAAVVLVAAVGLGIYGLVGSSRPGGPSAPARSSTPTTAPTTPVSGYALVGDVARTLADSLSPGAPGSSPYRYLSPHHLIDVVGRGQVSVLAQTASAITLGWRSSPDQPPSACAEVVKVKGAWAAHASVACP